MRTHPGVLALVSAVLLCQACGPLQTYGQAMQLACDAPIDCTECATAEPAHRRVRLAQYIDEHTWNRDARKVFSALGTADLAEKGRIIRQAAAAAGVTDCPLADLYVLPTP